MLGYLPHLQWKFYPQNLLDPAHIINLVLLESIEVGPIREYDGLPDINSCNLFVI